MSTTIELPIPNAETREEIRKLAHQLAMDSIVLQTLERYLIQVLTEVHESRVKPLLEELAHLREALKPLADLAVPEGQHEGTAGFYSIRFREIDAAQAALKLSEPTL